MNSSPMTYEKLLGQAERQLAQAGVPDAGLDAWYLMEDTFCLRRADYLWKKKECPAVIPDCWQERIRKRCERMPLAYILGSTEFMGLPFAVEPGVLIPRQDTETLVEWVLEDERVSGHWQQSGESCQSVKLLDVCTGSGCIGLSLAKLGGFSAALSDLSEQALAVAEKNRTALGLESTVQIYHGDLFSGLPDDARYDMIVSNPPYIETAVIETLQEEVKDYEPRMALDGEEDGLYFYRRLAAEASGWLKPKGRIYLEIGYDQGDSVPELLREAGFLQVEVRKDLAGNNRVVRGVYPDV